MSMHWKRVRVGPIRTNCYMLYQDAREDCVIIDPGEDPDMILDMIGPRKIAAIVLTHGHFDHIGALQALSAPGIHVWIHHKDAPMLTDPWLNGSEMLMGIRVTGCSADHFCEDGDTIEEAGMTLKCMHTPGHTPGSCCFLCDPLLFTGDTVMRMGIGRTDLPGGSDTAMRESLKRLEPILDRYTILGGHG